MSFFGAAYASWIASVPVTDLLGLGIRWIGVIGFLIGLLAISFAIKAVDTVQAIQPSQIWSAIVEAVRKRLGL